jgi:hypothetical protein
MDTTGSGVNSPIYPLTRISMGNLEKDYECERRDKNQFFKNYGGRVIRIGGMAPYYWPPIQILIAMADNRALASL